jgi:integrase
MKQQPNSGTYRLRWRALDIEEWRAIPQEKREAFERSKGKKNPPIRGADIPGRYLIDFYEGGKRNAKNINLRTSYDAHANDEAERLARQVALNYGDIEWRERHRFEAKAKGQVPFGEFFNTLVEGRHWSWMGTQRLLQSFPLKDSPLADIDYDWLSQIQEYFLKAPTRSNRNLSQNSASTYYAKIKAALQIAVQRGLIPSNPTTKIKSIQQVPSQRVYLTLEEMQRLANTPCSDPEVKRAFLFSCYTGLRVSDVQALTWDNVRNGRIELRVKKTNTPDWIDLSPIVVKLLGNPGKQDELVFKLPPDGTIWMRLQTWAATAGITKHISFHVSRHSFATLMLQQTGDLYLVSKLMGHTDIKHTQIYAKIIDGRKRDAMMSMPMIDLMGSE